MHGLHNMMPDIGMSQNCSNQRGSWTRKATWFQQIILTEKGKVQITNLYIFRFYEHLFDKHLKSHFSPFCTVICEVYLVLLPCYANYLMIYLKKLNPIEMPMTFFFFCTICANINICGPLVFLCVLPSTN